MGMRIYCVGSLKPPRDIALELSCDRCARGGFFNQKAKAQTFKGDFVAARMAATEAGWLETFKKGKREFIGPCCKDKKARASQ
jgi:hypothetical protein